MKEYVRKFIDLGNGEKYAYLEEGIGKKVLVLVHGNLSSSIHYTPLIEKIKEEYHIYAPDLRGFGDSTYNARFDHLDTLADDLKLFCDKLGLKDFAIAGWSTGGDVALSLAARYEGYVNHVFLIDSISDRGHLLLDNDGNRYKDKEEMVKKHAGVYSVVAAIENHNFDIMNMIWQKLIYTGSVKPNEDDNEIFIEESLKQKSVVDTEWGWCTFNISNHDSLYAKGNGLANKILVPVDVMHCDKDIVVPMKEAEELCADLKNATFHLITDSGHSPLVGNIDAVTKVFLGK